MNIFRPRPQQPLIQVSPPVVIPEAPPIAAGLPVPSGYPVNNRPSLLNLFTNPFGNLLGTNNNGQLSLNIGWVSFTYWFTCIKYYFVSNNG
jgi:hypothetical protein